MSQWTGSASIVNRLEIPSCGVRMVDLGLFNNVHYDLHSCNVRPLAGSAHSPYVTVEYTCARQDLHQQCAPSIKLKFHHAASIFLSCSATLLAVRTLLRPRGFDFQVVFVSSFIRLHVPVPVCCRSSMARRYAMNMHTSAERDSLVRSCDVHSCRIQ